MGVNGEKLVSQQSFSECLLILVHLKETASDAREVGLQEGTGKCHVRITAAKKSPENERLSSVCLILKLLFNSTYSFSKILVDF